MSADALVAGRAETSTAFGGAGLLDSASQLSASLQSGDWVAAGLSGVGVALDTAAAVVDPLGSLIAAGLGWLMEHLEPLKGWLDDLTGDAGAVLGFAATWENVATAVTGAGDELDRLVTADLEAMSGASVAAYAAYATGLADRVRAAGGSASAMASALRTCATVVQVVHDLVRDTLAQLVGSIIAWAAELVLTLGLSTPLDAGVVAGRAGRAVRDRRADVRALAVGVAGGDAGRARAAGVGSARAAAGNRSRGNGPRHRPALLGRRRCCRPQPLSSGRGDPHLLGEHPGEAGLVRRRPARQPGPGVPRARRRVDRGDRSSDAGGPHQEATRLRWLTDPATELQHRARRRRSGSAARGRSGY